MCTTDDCDKPAWQCGLCHGCYSRKRRANKRATAAYRRECAVCGDEFDADRPTRSVCSVSCRAAQANRSAKRKLAPKLGPARVPVRICAACGDRFASTMRYCGETCRARANADRRSPMRKAWERGDYPAFIDAVRARCLITGENCWLWPALGTNGYPRLSLIKGQRSELHRLMLVAAYDGLELGTQHAHHACAQPSCVNPDHLQPATHADNNLEMLSRRSYVTRIAELEAALAAVAPGHPVLHRIPLAVVA